MGGGDDPRPRPQRSTRSLRGLRYEDMTKGSPPRTVTATPAYPDTTPPQTSASQLSALSDASSFRRPPTSAASRPVTDRTSLLSQEIKRDSGIAPSILTSDGAPSLHSASIGGGAAREPSLPTIVVQDEALPGTNDHSRSLAGTSKSKEMPPHQTESVSDPGMPHMSGSENIRPDIGATATSTITTIPSIAMVEEIDLDDLASDKISFSNRGSLLFGGKKMQDLIASQAQDEDAGQSDGIADSTRGVTTPDNESRTAGTSSQNTPGDGDVQLPRQGLVAGRRKPSIQMLQAAIQGGRVLSAEEISFSRRVISMYERGDERAVNWVNSNRAMSARSTPDLSVRDSDTPDLEDHINKTVRPMSKQSSFSHGGGDPRASYYERESHELAGGIEDWDDIDGRDVDRYGFIHPNRYLSHSSATSSRQEGPGLQRIATSLRAEAEQPRRDRKIGRRPSIARSARSLPPKHGEGGLFTGRPGSVHSTHSTASRISIFQSKGRKILAEASDMLTLPPHLADIHEDENSSKTASAIKQREWSREEKWQKMARPVRYRSDAKGGGMRFEFDTTDSKLVERTWKGIPDRWRATAWHSFLSASAKKRNSPATDEELIGQFHKLQELNSADDVQIDVDVPRTVNMHIMFRRRYRGGQRLLFRVLHAVSLYFPDIGYVQGMASLAATLLCYYDEENAFVMMVRLWQLRGLERLFENGFAGLMACLGQFESDWLGGGDVARRLEELGINATAYGTRWYLTLFNMSLPFPAQLRVWDVFMLLGDEPAAAEGAFGGADLDVLHCTSAALIDATREILLDSDFENAMKVLTSFVPIKDEDVLMRVAKAEWKLKKKKKVAAAAAAGGGGGGGGTA